MSIYCLLAVFDVLDPLMFQAIYCLCLDKKKTFNVLLNDFIGSSLQGSDSQSVLPGHQSLNPVVY